MRDPSADRVGRLRGPAPWRSHGPSAHEASGHSRRSRGEPWGLGADRHA